MTRSGRLDADVVRQRLEARLEQDDASVANEAAAVRERRRNRVARVVHRVGPCPHGGIRPLRRPIGAAIEDDDELERSGRRRQNGLNDARDERLLIEDRHDD